MKRGSVFSGLLCLFAATISVHAISLSSSDLFESTTEGWRIGNNGVQPSWNSGSSFNGQPGFLRHFSDGGGPNGKWLMWSDEAEWRGNYVTAGVSSIGMWVDNRAGNPLALRIAFDGPGGWFYSSPQTVTDATPGGDDWVRLLYSLDAGNFTYAGGSGGSGQFADTITGVTRFEILGGGAAITYNGADIIDAGTSVNTLWLDNIAAVPEPSSLTLLLGAAAVLIARRRLT